MFEQTMSLLLSGEFICPIRYPDAYRYLSDKAHQKDVTAYLARIGRKLSVTGLGGGWYITFDQIGQDQRRSVRDEFSRIKLDLRFLVEFFVKAMRASEREEFYSRGDKIKAHALMAAIDSNPGLRAEFQALATVGRGSSSDGKLKSNLDRQLKYLRDEGYLVLANPEREIYQVTGKIEYLYEVVQFLMGIDGIADDVDEEGPTTPQMF